VSSHIRFEPGLSPRPMSWTVRCLAGLFLIGLGSAAVARRASWRHGASPFRAEFSIQSRPNDPRGGLAVSVPICGLGLEDGADLVAFDDAGNQLALLTLGRSGDNSAIALVRPAENTRRVYLYFGSKMRSPQHERAFLPGLTVDIRTLPDGPFNSWDEVAKLIKRSKRKGRLFVDRIDLGYNPVDSADSFIMIFDGYLRVARPGEQTFMLVSDDAGYLFVDGKLLIARNGRQWARTAQRGEARKTVQLSAGPHPIRCVVVEAGGTQMAVVARWISGRKKYILRPQDFLQPGKTKLERIESRYSSTPCPAFWIKPRSYMSYNGAQFTEVELGTYPGIKVDWRFSDGGRGSGSTTTRIFPGLYTREVSARRGRVSARGTVAFPETVPRRRFMSSAQDYDRYSSLILRQNVRDLDVRTLRGYITFFSYREMNEAALPVYEAIAGKARANSPECREALRGLARAAARNFPDKAERAYARLIRESAGGASKARDAREYMEFLLFRKRDPDAAAKLAEHLGRAVPEKLIQMFHVQIAIQRGKTDDAKKWLDRLLARREFSRNQRYNAVKSNALRERFYELLERGFLLDARKVLHDLEDISSEGWTDGSLSLARARWFEAVGWYDGALAELDGAISMNSLLPNLPDVELERAKICLKAGDSNKAQEILRRIRKQYPNHPAAKEASRWLR